MRAVLLLGCLSIAAAQAQEAPAPIVQVPPAAAPIVKAQPVQEPPAPSIQSTPISTPADQAQNPQTPPIPAPPQSLSQLNFLLGTWSARTAPTRSAASVVLGDFTFRPDLLKTVITRVSATDACAAPQSLDCQHYETLTIYRDSSDPALHALYLDSQGHTIHYNLSFPDANTVIFFSTGPGAQSRLIYHVQKNILSGKLQTAPSGSTNFTSTLEWFGSRLTPAEPVPGRPVMAQTTSHAFASLENNARVFLVFASQSADPQFTQQLAALADRDHDLADRNLILIPVLATWTIADKGLHDRNLPFTDATEQAYIRQRFKVPRTSFAILLLGKDGEEKLRLSSPITAARLFASIDAMPMRRQEMQEKSDQARRKSETHATTPQ